MSGTSSFELADATVVIPSNPFFIAGSGRCGTTLMRKLLVERTHAVVPPENYTLASSAQLMTRSGTDWEFFCRLVLNDMKSGSGGWEYFGIDADTALPLLSSVGPAYRTVANFWHAFHAIYALHVNKPASSVWGDKTPANTAQLADIMNIFSQAKFVFMVRDVFDMAWSYGSTAISGRVASYLTGANRWVHANTQILAFSEQHPTQVILVRYEDLVRFTDQEMHRVFNFLDLPARPASPLNHSEARDILLRPHLGNVLGDVSAEFVGKGRTSLTAETRQRISAVAAKLQHRFGYEPTGNPPSQSPRSC
jgi:hypothetical protein